MSIAALIVAAGRGTRAGGPVPKQWQMLGGKPVARWTLEKFAHLDHVVMVVAPDDMPRAQAVCDGLPVTLVTGGAERAASVRAGLESLAGDRSGPGADPRCRPALHHAACDRRSARGAGACAGRRPRPAGDRCALDAVPRAG